MPRSASRRTVVAVALAAPIALSLGQAGAQEATPAASDNEAIARAFYEPFNTGDTSIYDQILAEDWVDHPLAPGQQPGRAGFPPVVAGFRAVFPDLTITNEDVIVAGEKVTVRSIARGTHLGPLLGIPTTGKQVEFAAIDIHRIANGQIVETWHIEDYLSLLFQLGATITPPASATPTA
ncbi:MAG TPA: ester cyclase [Thermomicrobiales bacterium]|nr:ester cyclase [Thermomicrobiales bacterium]